MLCISAGGNAMVGLVSLKSPQSNPVLSRCSSWGQLQPAGFGFMGNRTVWVISGALTLAQELLMRSWGQCKCQV